MKPSNVALMKLIIDDIFPEFEWDDSSERTAERFVAYLKEYAPGPRQFKLTTFPVDVNQLIMCGPIRFSSVCKHHLLPYTGTAWVGYIPNDLMVGASKIPRLVKWCATKPSTQEELTAEIASYLKHELSAMGVAVTMNAVHTCMACRGVREEDAHLITSEMRGVFLTSGEARHEYLTLMTER